MSRRRSIDVLKPSGFVAVCPNVHCQRHGQRIDLETKPTGYPICDNCEGEMVVYGPAKKVAA